MLVTGVHQLRVLSTVPVGTEREIGRGPGLGPTLSSGGALWEAETQGQVCSLVTKAGPVATVTPVIKINRELPRGSTAPVLMRVHGSLTPLGGRCYRYSNCTHFTNEGTEAPRS